MRIGKYEVFSSNFSKTQEGSCSVKLNDVVLVKLFFGNKSKPLNWIRNNPQSEERQRFVAACKQADIPSEDINAILSSTSNKLGQAK